MYWKQLNENRKAIRLLQIILTFLPLPCLLTGFYPKVLAPENENLGLVDSVTSEAVIFYRKHLISIFYNESLL